jgi:hypothetical protein
MDARTDIGAGACPFWTPVGEGSRDRGEVISTGRTVITRALADLEEVR